MRISPKEDPGDPFEYDRQSSEAEVAHLFDGRDIVCISSQLRTQFDANICPMQRQRSKATIRAMMDPTAMTHQKS
jgi:hypothetical protein